MGQVEILGKQIEDSRGEECNLFGVSRGNIFLVGKVREGGYFPKYAHE